jgi:hypothetical protein
MDLKEVNFNRQLQEIQTSQKCFLQTKESFFLNVRFYFLLSSTFYIFLIVSFIGERVFNFDFSFYNIEKIVNIYFIGGFILFFTLLFLFFHYLYKTKGIMVFEKFFVDKETKSIVAIQDIASLYFFKQNYVGRQKQKRISICWILMTFHNGDEKFYRISKKEFYILDDVFKEYFRNIDIFYEWNKKKNFDATIDKKMRSGKLIIKDLGISLKNNFPFLDTLIQYILSIFSFLIDIFIDIISSISNYFPSFVKDFFTHFFIEKDQSYRNKIQNNLRKKFKKDGVWFIC